MTQGLRDLAMQAAAIAQDAGEHALTDQVTPKDLSSLYSVTRDYSRGLTVDTQLAQFIYNRLTYIDAFQGRWSDRPEHGAAGDRYWCIGGIDGVINYTRNMAEWAITISLFEFNEHRRTPWGDKREKIMPSTTPHLEGSVVSFGMSFKSNESKYALDVVADIAGKPADIKRIGPISLDLCKVADGTYDAYFEPFLHQWDVPAVSAGAVVLWEAQGQLSTWSGNLVHWRSENDVVASNGLIIDDLRPYLMRELEQETSGTNA